MKTIPLTQNKFTLVDDGDFEFLNQFKWYACFQRGRWYAHRMVKTPNGRRKPIGLHHFLLGEQPGKEIDHRFGNGLDNQRENLRFVTRTENNANRRKSEGTSSKFKGVTWVTRLGRWQAQIQIKKVHKYLGRFDLEKDAALAYDAAARAEFGEFAKTNFEL